MKKNLERRIVMKIIKVVLSFLITIILCIGMVRTSALAASNMQDGVKVDLTTDKENYAKDEKITALLTVTNTNSTPIKNVSLEMLGLKGYKLSDSQKEIEFLGSNESISLKAVYTIKNVSSEVVGNDDKNPPIISETMDSTKLMSSNSFGNMEGSAKYVDSVNTGDKTKIVPGLVMFVLSLICIIVKLLCKKKNGIFFVVLFATLLAGTFLSGISMKAEAADSEKTVQIQTKIQLGKQHREIGAIVKYTLESTETSSDDGITREEWIVELCGIIGVNAASDGHYSYEDVNVAQNPDLIESAIRNGFVPIKPDQDNKIYFRPQEYATREFAAYTAVHALKYVLNEEKVDGWTDSAEITYPKEAAKAVSMQILFLIENSFLPNRKLTVSEKDIALKRIAEIIKSWEIIGENNGNIQYTDGVHTTELIYEVDELNKKVYIMEPEKIVGWQAGEVHILSSSDQTQEDIAVKIVDITQEDGWTVIHYNKPAIEEVVTSFEVEGKESTQGEFIPAEGVIIENSIARATSGGSVPLFGKLDISAEINGYNASINMDFKELEYRFSANTSEDVFSFDEVYLVLNNSIECEVPLITANIEDKFKLGTIKVPLGYGFNAFGDIYFLANIDGTIEIKMEISRKDGIQYTKDNGFRLIVDDDPVSETLALECNSRIGLGTDIGIGFLGIDIVEQGTEGGIGSEAILDYITDIPKQFCTDLTDYFFLEMYVQIGTEEMKLKGTFEICNSENSIYKINVHIEETGVVQECSRGSGSYQGYVTLTDGFTPVEHAMVQVFQGDRLKDTTYTDKDGKFVGNQLIAGAYTLKVSLSGYLPYEEEFEITAGVTRTLEPQLTSTTMCSVTITDASTKELIKNIRGAIIIHEFNDQGEETGVLYLAADFDEKGTYSFGLQAGTYTLEVSIDGYTMNYQTVTLDSANNNLHFYLNPKTRNSEMPGTEIERKSEPDIKIEDINGFLDIETDNNQEALDMAS